LIFFFFFFWVAFCFVTFFFLEGGEREGKEQGATRYDIKFVLNEWGGTKVRKRLTRKPPAMDLFFFLC
jgi:hypothetical protein